jgi:hypothetical protein
VPLIVILSCAVLYVWSGRMVHGVLEQLPNGVRPHPELCRAGPSAGARRGDQLLLGSLAVPLVPGLPAVPFVPLLPLAPFGPLPGPP